MAKIFSVKRKRRSPKPRLKARRLKAISAKQKRPGRPATGSDPLVGIRIAETKIAIIDRWANARSMTRSGAVRALLDIGLLSEFKGAPFSPEIKRDL